MVGQLKNRHTGVHVHHAPATVIVIVMGQLLPEAVMPVSLILRLFVGLFVGIVQAFVFTMLWLTYYSGRIAEERTESA